MLDFEMMTYTLFEMIQKLPNPTEPSLAEERENRNWEMD